MENHGGIVRGQRCERLQAVSRQIFFVLVLFACCVALSADYAQAGDSFFGWSIDSAPCAFSGNGQTPWLGGGSSSVNQMSKEWVSAADAVKSSGGRGTSNQESKQVFVEQKTVADPHVVFDVATANRMSTFIGESGPKTANFDSRSTFQMDTQKVTQPDAQKVNPPAKPASGASVDTWTEYFLKYSSFINGLKDTQQWTRYRQEFRKDFEKYLQENRKG